jgi:hypothetical protein
MASLPRTASIAAAPSEVVGEEDRDVAPVFPPGQLRDIDSSIYFSSGTRVRGNFEWNYMIGDIRARQ